MAVTDLTLLAGDSPDEFRNRSGDRIRNRLLVQTNIPQDMMDKETRTWLPHC